MAKAERIQASRVFDTEEVAPARYVFRVAVGPHADLAVLSLDGCTSPSALRKRRLPLLGQVAMFGLR